MIRRVAPLILLAMAIGGCGKQTADQWLKERMFRPTPAQRILNLESPHADVRREAILAIEAKPDAYRSPSVVKILCLLARESSRPDVPESDPMVRAAACRVLGIMKSEDAVRALGLAVRKDSNKFVRADAALALGRQGSPNGQAALAEALQNDRDVDVRIAAAEALRYIKTRESAAALAAALAVTDIGVARKCWESLRYMTGLLLPCEVEAWTAYLESAEDPFAGYGKPPVLPKGVSQRSEFTQNLNQFIEGLFGSDPGEAELQ